jgi:hypothetical protein
MAYPELVIGAACSGALLLLWVYRQMSSASKLRSQQALEAELADVHAADRPKCISCMEVGEFGFVRPATIVRDKRNRLWLEPTRIVHTMRSDLWCLKVWLTSSGFRCDLADVGLYFWDANKVDENALIKVVQATHPEFKFSITWGQAVLPRQYIAKSLENRVVRPLYFGLPMSARAGREQKSPYADYPRNEPDDGGLSVGTAVVLVESTMSLYSQ